MNYIKEIEIEPRVKAFCNTLLSREDMDEDTEDVPFIFTAAFAHGIEVDIKMVNAIPSYVDAVIFQDGHELFCLEPYFESIDGRYDFPIDDNIYTVIIK